MESEHEIPIWFFIGALLGIYGVLIFLSGLYGLVVPPKVALAHLHVDIWWGLLMTAVGAFYCLRFRPDRKRDQEIGNKERD